MTRRPSDSPSPNAPLAGSTPALPLTTVALAALLAIAASACDRWAGDCTSELGWRFRPVNPVVRVGDAFYPTLQLTSCGGRKTWNPAVTWRAVDTLVARVDTASGRVTARAPGSTELVAYEKSAGNAAYGYHGLVLTVVPR